MKKKLRFIKHLLILFLSFAVYGCSSYDFFDSSPIVENKEETISISETIELDNCTGNTAISFIVTRSFEINVIEFGNNNQDDIESIINSKYSKYQHANEPLVINIQPGIRKQFYLEWIEELHSGMVTQNSEEFLYQVIIPVSVRVLSDSNYECPFGGATPEPLTLSSTESHTPTLTITSSPIPLEDINQTQEPSNIISYCDTYHRNLCLYDGDRDRDNNLTMYFYLDPIINDSYYLLFEGKKYFLEPIADYPKRFVCYGFPGDQIAKTNHFLIYTSNNQTLIAEGELFLYYDVFRAAETPTPKNPYTP